MTVYHSFKTFSYSINALFRSEQTWQTETLFAP